MPTVVSIFGVEPSRIGGTETFARELSHQLAALGWKSVLCFASQPPEDVAKFLSLPSVTIEVLNDSTSFNWNGTKHLIRILKKHRPDILHLHFTGFLSVVPWVARTCAVKKIFFTDHSSRPENYVPLRAPFWKRWLVRLVNHPIEKVICVSRYGCSCLQPLDVLPKDRYVLVYNGVDLSRVHEDFSRAGEFRRRFGIPDSRKLVVQVSWIIPEKGIPQLLEVARIVKANDDETHFVIVGEGPYREQFMNQAREMGLSDTVTWTGQIKDPFGEGVFQAADVVCQLSRWEEVFGWMIAEAMAFGKPVVATRVGGIPEVVDDGQTGFLVERVDIVGTAERVQRLVNDEELRAKFGAAGREKARSKFSLETNVAQLLRVYGILKP